MAAPSDDMATLWYLTRRAAALMDRAGERLFRAELGISLAQFLVLSVVDAHPGLLNQQVVADRLGLSKGTISRQLEAAVDAGLMMVEVSPHSRRENVVSLTSKGSALVRRGDKAVAEAQPSDLSSLSASELAAAVKVLSALNEMLESQG